MVMPSIINRKAVCENPKAYIVKVLIDSLTFNGYISGVKNDFPTIRVPVTKSGDITFEVSWATILKALNTGTKIIY
jgi:hypothetical protein